jgi:hypothetical protein
MIGGDSPAVCRNGEEGAKIRAKRQSRNFAAKPGGAFRNNPASVARIDACEHA